MTSLAGRTVLISGASSGLGAGFARIVARAGANVVLGARRVERCAALAEEIANAGGSAMAVPLDVTDEASVIAAFDWAEQCFGTVNGVVANAGTGFLNRSTEAPLAHLRAVMETNLLGAYLLAREGARRMIAAGSKKRGDGRIVMIGSITAKQHHKGDAMYAATKAGLAHLARQFAREWVRQGINVNTLEPGWILTDINAEWFASDAGKADIVGNPRRRLLEPHALDDMLLYLLSDGSAQITGSTFTIDDGQHL